MWPPSRRHPANVSFDSRTLHMAIGAGLGKVCDLVNHRPVIRIETATIMSLPRNLFGGLLVGAMFACSLVYTELAAQHSPRTGEGQGRGEFTQYGRGDDQVVFRKREGVAFEAEGYVQDTGERHTFISLDGKERLVLLENLALDRVALSVRDATSKTRWKVSGTVTEFQGANFLLLKGATMVHRNKD